MAVETEEKKTHNRNDYNKINLYCLIRNGFIKKITLCIKTVKRSQNILKHIDDDDCDDGDGYNEHDDTYTHTHTH